MVRLLKNDQIQSLLTVEDLIDPMEAAYEELGRGSAPDHPRNRYYLPLGEGRRYFFNNIIGADVSRDVMALRIDSGHRIERETRSELPDDRDHFTGLVFLFDVHSTDLIGVLDDVYLSRLRVAATSAVAARYLVNEDPVKLGLFGTGMQAGPQLEAFEHLFGFDDVDIYSPTTEHRNGFARKYDASLNASVAAVDSPEAVVDGSDVVITATNASVPVFDGDWLEPGTHVSTTVGGDYSNDRDEIDATTVRRADRIYCHRYSQLIDDRQGNLYRLLDSGELTEADVPELGALVAGNVEGRESNDEITLFKNNCGNGLQFAVAGSVALDRAESRDLGRELPTEWFTTDESGPH